MCVRVRARVRARACVCVCVVSTRLTHWVHMCERLCVLCAGKGGTYEPRPSGRPCKSAGAGGWVIEGFTRASMALCIEGVMGERENRDKTCVLVNRVAKFIKVLIETRTTVRHCHTCVQCGQGVPTVSSTPGTKNALLIGRAAFGGRAIRNRTASRVRLRHDTPPCGDEAVLARAR
jgi:hypothetical protein